MQAHKHLYWNVNERASNSYSFVKQKNSEFCDSSIWGSFSFCLKIKYSQNPCAEWDCISNELHWYKKPMPFRLLYKSSWTHIIWLHIEHIQISLFVVNSNHVAHSMHAPASTSFHVRVAMLAIESFIISGTQLEMLTFIHKNVMLHIENFMTEWWKNSRRSTWFSVIQLVGQYSTASDRFKINTQWDVQYTKTIVRIVVL